MIDIAFKYLKIVADRNVRSWKCVPYVKRVGIELE